LDTLRAAHAEVEREIAARAQPGAELRGVLATLERLLDVFESLEDIGDRRRLLQQCLSRVVVRQDALEVHVLSHELIIPPDEATEGANVGPKVSRKVHSARLEGHLDTAKRGDFGARIPAEVHPANGKSTGPRERMGVHAAFTATRHARAAAQNPWSPATRSA
jgi:hypothetical protein